jgi:hypothetical protein
LTNPADYLNLIRQRLYGRTYNKENPEAVKFDVFSASVLAKDPFKQVRMKIRNEPFSSTRKIMIGNAVHDYIQEDLSKQGGCEPPGLGGAAAPQFVHEFKLTNEIPFAWKHLPSNHILILGHIDTLDMWNHHILEYKYSELDEEKIAEMIPIYVIQAGYYATLQKMQTGVVHGASVFTVNDTTNERVLTDEEKENGYAVIVRNALNAARMIDSWLESRPIVEAKPR